MQYSLKLCVELRYLRSMRCAGAVLRSEQTRTQRWVQSGHGGNTMEKETYETPEIREEVAPGGLAVNVVGSPSFNQEIT